MGLNNQYRNLIRYSFILIMLSALIGVWVYIWMHYYADIIIRPFYYRGNLLVIVVYALLLFFFIKFYGGFRIGYYKRGNVIYAGFLSLVMCNIVTYFQISLIGRALMDTRPMLVMVLAQIAFFIAWTLVACKLYVKVFSPRTLLMVYGGEELTNSLLRKMSSYPENYSIHDTINISEGLDNVLNEISKQSGVILCDIPSSQRNILLKFCFERGIRTYTTPKISDILIRGASEIHLFDTPLLLNRNAGLSPEQRAIKRLTDIIFSGLAFIICLPFMLIIALAVKLCDQGPVIYKQKRLTIGHREFCLYKFRSMIVDAEKQHGVQLATEKDNRITPVGRVIRMLRMDELPQLWNILKGDMSIVGPRPERPEISMVYTETMPEFEYRLKVKAGLTGLAQTVGRYNTTAYDKLRMDLDYISNYSILQDFKLMLMTVKVLFEKESTKGVGA